MKHYTIVNNEIKIDPKLVEATRESVELQKEELATKDRVDLSRKEYEETRAELARLRKIETSYNAVIDKLNNALLKFNEENLKEFAAKGEAQVVTTGAILEKLESEEPVIYSTFSPYSLITTISLGYGFKMQELKGVE